MALKFFKHLLHKTLHIAKSSHLRMSTHATMNTDTRYREAVELLNGLQPIVSTLDQVVKPYNRTAIITNTRMCLSKLGFKPEDWAKLNVIHVSGTKGKGSTCAFSESILRHKGYKTGFFSSPHIIEVRERIRLDGKPISKEKFADYFMHCHRILSQHNQPEEMPNYFRFLCIMAHVVFLQEGVDVAIFEVGLGGEFDSTNVIMNPSVVGVSSLGYDHTDFLGDTLAEIAWNKAGIFKPGTPAVTVPQKEEAMAVLVARAREKKVPLYVCQQLPLPQSSLGIPGQIQKLNASLALHLTNIWLQRHAQNNTPIVSNPHDPLPIDLPPLQVTPDLLQGLSKCFWPGRCQTIKTPGVTYYLDGAHTEESMHEASSWFYTKSLEEAAAHKGRVLRVLMFTITGYRDAKVLMKELMKFNFDYALFTTTLQKSLDDIVGDLKNLTITKEEVIGRCFENQQMWQKCLQEREASYCESPAAHATVAHATAAHATAAHATAAHATAAHATVAHATAAHATADYATAHHTTADNNTTNSKASTKNAKTFRKNGPLPPLVLPPYPITHLHDTSCTISFVMPSIQDALVWISNNRDRRFSYSASEAQRAGFKFAFNDRTAGGGDKVANGEVIAANGVGVDSISGVNGVYEGVNGIKRCDGVKVGDNSTDDLLVQVVCMGSLYLVGGTLSFLDPGLGY